MIVIQQDVWRADCIAAIGLHELSVTVLPANCSVAVEYPFGTEEETNEAYETILKAWKREFDWSEPE